MKRDGTLPASVGTSLVIAAVGALGSAAQAEIIGPGITITATNSLGTSTYTVELDDPFSETFPNGNWRYVLPDPVVMRNDTGDVIATLNDLRGDVFTNPHVLIVFDVTAGMSDTVFQVSSAIETVGPFPAASAMGGGAAAMTWADSNGVGGATVTGLYGDGAAHRMLINGVAPGFGNPLASVLVGPFTVASGTDSTFVNTGGIPAGVAITSIGSQFRFRLSAGDTATGNSTFTVIPTPGAAALLGLGIFAYGFRRKR